eukprot:CAMPEP_0114557162 /NCGR_PEP_ID=MMETSP0114-20121206/9677_1 /TAXON_ID=31324 /ORGANISM="Goniomonas sp, Strain m" /LENGTH=165 /DNA_ID=CAMNT_0001742419 /DNA_START=19 /DNA_END=513 /DNA_ORIENTATION=+
MDRDLLRAGAPGASAKVTSAYEDEQTRRAMKTAARRLEEDKAHDGTLHVTVLQARGLINKSTFGTVSPFARLQFASLPVQNSPAIKGTAPVWNANFTFEIDFRTPKVAFWVSVYGKKRMQPDCFLGMASFTFKDILDGKHRGPEWIPLDQRNLRSRVAGDVLLEW